MSTCNRLDLQTLEFQPLIMPKNKISPTTGINLVQGFDVGWMRALFKLKSSMYALQTRFGPAK